MHAVYTLVMLTDRFICVKHLSLRWSRWDTMEWGGRQMLGFADGCGGGEVEKPIVQVIRFVSLLLFDDC